MSVSLRKHERTHWQEQRSRSRTVSNSDGTSRTETEYYTEYFNGEEFSVVAAAPLQLPVVGDVGAGTQFSLPFQFMLPPGLAPTAGIRQGHAWAFIRYALFVSINRISGDSLDSNTHILLNVVTMQPPQIGAAQRQQQDRPLVTCCCIKRGTIHAELDVSATAALLGERLAAKTSIVVQPSNREILVRPATVELRCVLHTNYGASKYLVLQANEVAPHAVQDVPFGGREFQFSIPMPTEAATFQSSLIKTSCITVFEAKEAGCCTEGMNFTNDVQLFGARFQQPPQLQQAQPMAPQLQQPPSQVPDYVSASQGSAPGSLQGPPPAHFQFEPTAPPAAVYF
eukprot:TRINITY_DN5865_c0_g1_i1.p1 TRINITY_DN5865_c0_g1~~TRINITY_DN5865_c0_g1_i1.p1  ORF type:complete len:392 (+),score=77.81 TRINITY_DN5865_c0_g1_i1:157-1176(+)